MRELDRRADGSRAEPFLFKEQVIYEQSVVRTVREQQESDRASDRASH